MAIAPPKSYKNKKKLKIEFLTLKNLDFDTKTIFLALNHQYLHSKQFFKFFVLSPSSSNPALAGNFWKAKFLVQMSFLNSILLKIDILRQGKNCIFFIFQKLYLRLCGGLFFYPILRLFNKIWQICMQEDCQEVSIL